MKVTKTRPAVNAVHSLVKDARRIVDPIAGEFAAVLANIIHEAGIDSPGQAGYAYFRCRACGQARDCIDADEIDIEYILKGGVSCPDCDHTFVVEDLRISEGWVERL